MLRRGQTPIATILPRFNAEQDLEEIASEFDGICSRNDQRRLKDPCLQRDEERCVVTDFYDQAQADKLPISERADLITVETQAAHILPFSLGDSVVRFLNWDSERTFADHLLVQRI